MKTEIDLSVIETALLKLGEATARQIADETGLEPKDVTRALNAMLSAAAVEREKRGSEYVYWLTSAAAPTKPTAKPKAAAVAVQALHTSGAPADITEQLRQARAEQLAMSQTIVEICCAIGHDPQATTTSQLPQLVRDYIDAQIERETGSFLGVISDIRAAIGDNGQLMLGDLAEHIRLDYSAARCDMQQHFELRKALAPITAELFEGEAYTCTEPEAIRTMSQLIDAQAAELNNAARQIAEQEQQITELRANLQAQITAGLESFGSTSKLLTEVHEILANGWPSDIEAPRGRTTLQLAQEMREDFNQLYEQYLAAAAPKPDAYLVTRSDDYGVTRHKNEQAAHRKAKSAIRAGAQRAEILAATRIAIAVRGAEIKPV